MTDPVAIALIAACTTVVTTTLTLLVSLKTHNSVIRVEKSTNGLLADRDRATSTIAHAAGVAEQKAKDAPAGT